MGEKIEIKICDIIQCLTSKYEPVADKVKFTDCVEDIMPEVVEYYDAVECAIKEFFFSENAGDAIKKLYTLPEDMKVVAINYMFAVHQYKEYRHGMNKYVDELKMKDCKDQTVVEGIHKVMDKDHSFVDSIFTFGQNENNKEVEMDLCEALHTSFEALLKIQNKIQGFKNPELTRSELDKLIVGSTVHALFELVKGVMTQTERIVHQVNGDPCHDEEERPRFAMF